MRKILAIIWKDAIIRFASPIELLFYLVLPILFTMLLAGGTGGPADSRVGLVVVDQANSALSQQLVATLQKSSSVRPELLSLDAAQSQFKSRAADAVLILPVDFNTTTLESGGIKLQLLQQPNDLNALVAGRAVNAAAESVSSAVRTALISVQQAEKIKPFASAAVRQAYFEQSLTDAERQMEAVPDRLLLTRANTEDSIDYNAAADSSAGQLITWVFIPLLSISSLFAYERNQGTLRRLLTTPTERATFLLGTITGQVLTALVQMFILVGFGIWVMKLDWGHDMAGLAVILVSCALAGAAIGTTMGTFIKTEGQANGLSILLGMVMALMGGCWYPLELFPPFIQTVVHALPTTWAMQGMLDLVLRGQGLMAILPNAGVLLGFAIFFFAVGVWRFRFE